MSLSHFPQSDLTYSSIDNTNSCDLIEKEYHKLQLELLKKDKEIEALKSDLCLFKSSSNNTSSHFPLPSEFKDYWLNFIQFILMESFDTIYLNKPVLAIVVQVSFKAIYSMTLELIRSRLCFLLKSFGIQDADEAKIQAFYIKYKKILLQDYYKTLFTCDEDFIKAVIEAVKKELFEVNLFDYAYSHQERLDIVNDLRNKEMSEYIRKGFDLCLFMHLHEPPLALLVKNKVEYVFYSKYEHINIEGFIREESPCLVVLHPPMIKDSFPFNGLKAAICACEENSEEVISQCNKAKDSTVNNKVRQGVRMIEYCGIVIDSPCNTARQIVTSDLLEGEGVIESDSTKSKTQCINPELSNHFIELNKACSSRDITANMLQHANLSGNDNYGKHLTIQQKSNSTTDLNALKYSSQAESPGNANAALIEAQKEQSPGYNINDPGHLLLPHCNEAKNKLNDDNKQFNKCLYHSNWVWISRNSTKKPQYNSYTNFNKYQIIKPECTLNGNRKPISSLADLHYLNTPVPFSKVKQFALYSHNSTSNHPIDNLSKTISAAHKANHSSKTKSIANNSGNIALPNEVELRRRASLNYTREKALKCFEGSRKVNKSKAVKALKTSSSYTMNKHTSQRDYSQSLRAKTLRKPKTQAGGCSSESKYKKYNTKLEYNTHHIDHYYQERKQTLNSIEKREMMTLTIHKCHDSNRQSECDYMPLNSQENVIANNEKAVFNKNHYNHLERESALTRKKDNTNKFNFNTISFRNALQTEATKAKNPHKVNQICYQSFPSQSNTQRMKSFPLKYYCTNKTEM